MSKMETYPGLYKYVEQEEEKALQVECNIIDMPTISVSCMYYYLERIEECEEPGKHGCIFINSK